QYEDPRAKLVNTSVALLGTSFGLRFLVQILTVARYAFLTALVGFILLLLDPMSGLDPSFTTWLRETFNKAHPWRLVLAGAIALALLALFQHVLTSLKLAVQFKELNRKGEVLRQFAIDCLRLLIILVAVTAFLVVSQYVPGYINSLVTEILKISFLLGC